MSDSPASILYDSAGTEKGTDTNPVRTDPTGATAQPITDGGGSVTVDGAVSVSGSVAVTNFPAVQPVSDNGGSLTVDTPQLPSALVGGRLDQNVGAWLGATTPTVGQKTRAASLPVTLASDQPAVPVTFTEANARTGVSSGGLVLRGSTAGTKQVVRATTYVEPTTAAQRSVVSSSANDSAAGTGARTITIHYFDSSGTGPHTETITLNGTTPVNTVATNIQFIERIEVETVGSLGANAGTISLYTATAGGGTVIGSIGFGTLLTGVGDNRTRWAHHYISQGWKGKTAVLVVGIQSGGSGTSGRFFVTQRHPLTADSAEVVLNGSLLIYGSFTRQLQFPSVSDGSFEMLTAYCIPGVNNTEIAATFDWSETPV